MQQITGKLALQLTGEEKQQLDKHYTNNTDAFLLYLSGRYYFGEQTREGYEKSIELYQQAIIIDSNYALAYAGLAQTYSFLRGNGLLPTSDIRQRQEEAADQAVRLDQELAEAHLALAEVKSENWDWTHAEQEYQRAIELNPGGADFHARYAHYLKFVGRIDEAEAQSRRALELDPKSAVRYAGVGRTISAPGRYDQAIEWFRQAIAMRPHHAPFYTNLGDVYLSAGMYDKAIEVLKEARKLDDDPSRRGRFAFLAYAYAVSGRNDEARKMLAELKAKAEHNYIPPYNFAIIYHGLGDRDRTFDWLEKAYAERFPALSDIKTWGESDPFRTDPRYADLLRRMNLSP
jgi:tetratricopeptide (TPR) repeat protein